MDKTVRQAGGLRKLESYLSAIGYTCYQLTADPVASCNLDCAPPSLGTQPRPAFFRPVPSSPPSPLWFEVNAPRSSFSRSWPHHPCLGLFVLVYPLLVCCCPKLAAAMPPPAVAAGRIDRRRARAPPAPSLVATTVATRTSTAATATPAATTTPTAAVTIATTSRAASQTNSILSTAAGTPRPPSRLPGPAPLPTPPAGAPPPVPPPVPSRRYIQRTLAPLPTTTDGPSRGSAGGYWAERAAKTAAQAPPAATSLFAGLLIYFTGINGGGQYDLGRAVWAGGGRVALGPSAAVTHTVADAMAAGKASRLGLGAGAGGAPGRGGGVVVTSAWLRECLRTGQRVPVREYLLGRTTEVGDVGVMLGLKRRKKERDATEGGGTGGSPV